MQTQSAACSWPAVPQGSLAEAKATQVAPTLVALLGLPVSGFQAAPVF